MTDASNTTKARYQPIFFLSRLFENKRKRERLRGDGCSAVCRKEDGGFHVGAYSASSDQSENVQTHNRPCEIFHSVGTFPPEFLWHFFHSWRHRVISRSEIVG